MIIHCVRACVRACVCAHAVSAFYHLFPHCRRQLGLITSGTVELTNIFVSKLNSMVVIPVNP